MTDERSRALWEPISAAIVVTLAVMGISLKLPSSYVAVGVALVFLGATWFFVFRHTDDVVLRSGLGLGGLIAQKKTADGEPSRADAKEMALAASKALLIAALLGVVTFVPFYLGFRYWWHPRHGFSLHIRVLDLASLCAGQLFVIALPEEAFFRGYMQSRLDQAFPKRARILGADLGLSVLVTSVIFAIGHLATVQNPSRLAVFFPSLLFGYLRARTGGVGSGIAYHAMCNVYSELLGRGFGVY